MEERPCRNLLETHHVYNYNYNALDIFYYSKHIIQTTHNEYCLKHGTKITFNFYTYVQYVFTYCGAKTAMSSTT